MILGNIERVQELIKLMDINGHDSDSDTEDTALIKAAQAGRCLKLYYNIIRFILVLPHSIWILFNFFFTFRTRKNG